MKEPINVICIVNVQGLCIAMQTGIASMVAYWSVKNQFRED